jgi:phage gp46-like protein
MQDLKKVMNADGLFTLSLVNGDFEVIDGMETAVLVSLYTDARLDESEVKTPLMRSGWIGNIMTQGRQLGGKLWKFENSPVTTSYLANAKEATQRSFDWMINDKVARSITAAISAQKATNGMTNISHQVGIVARDGVKQDYVYLWDRTKPFFERVR